jgi:hypothetical protein
MVASSRRWGTGRECFAFPWRACIGGFRRHRANPADFLQDDVAPQKQNRPMTTRQIIYRAALAYFAAAIVGYIVAISLATSANLINLARIGAQIGFADALRTYAFDLWGMTPRFELARYGNVMLIGFAIAFPVAALLRALVMRGKATVQRLAPLLYPLAGAVAIGTGLTIMFQQYEVTAVAGARGLGFWAQCVAGAIAGCVFQLVLTRRSG